jgi:hypothetical protein
LRCWLARGPQSVQSAPWAHSEYSDPLPPANTRGTHGRMAMGVGEEGGRTTMGMGMGMGEREAGGGRTVVAVVIKSIEASVDTDVLYGRGGGRRRRWEHARRVPDVHVVVPRVTIIGADAAAYTEPKTTLSVESTSSGRPRKKSADSAEGLVRAQRRRTCRGGAWCRTRRRPAHCTPGLAVRRGSGGQSPAGQSSCCTAWDED